MKCPICHKVLPCSCEENEDMLYRFDRRSTVDYKRRQKEMKQRRAEKKAKKAEKVNNE